MQYLSNKDQRNLQVSENEIVCNIMYGKRPLTYEHPLTSMVAFLQCKLRNSNVVELWIFFLISMQQTRWPLLPWGIKNIGSVCSSDSHSSCTSKPVRAFISTVSVS